MASRLGGLTSATVIKLLVSRRRLPSESSAMTFRRGKAKLSPMAKGRHKPRLSPKKLGPRFHREDHSRAVVDRLVTVSTWSSIQEANSLRQSKRFTTAPRQSRAER